MNYLAKIKAVGGEYNSDGQLPTGKALDKRLQGLQFSVPDEIPPNYIEFLKTCGGYGLPSLVAYPTTEDCGSGGQETVLQFYGILADDTDDFDVSNALDVYEDRVPEGYLPIGEDPAGNLICLKLGDGSVWFWNHEEEAEGETNLRLINSSFDGFINSLTDEDAAR